MRKIKIAQIGTSEYSHGVQIFDSLKKQSDIFEIAGFVLPENEKEKFPQHIKVFEGYKELTPDEVLNDPEIEAVAVETEETHLTGYATLAAQHGKHIHMEKPGGVVLADFERLIETVKKNKTVFHTGYMYRYNPEIIRLMESIKNGELGEIISVEAQMNCIHGLPLRNWLSAFPGGMMFFLGCHLIDLILQIKGMPENIIPLSRSTSLESASGKDFGMAVLEYKNGVSFAKTTAVEIGGFARRQLVVSGSKKTVEIKPLEMYDGDLQYTTATEYDSAGWADTGKTENSQSYDRYDSMMASFAAMVRGEKENPYTCDYELELYKTVLKACGAGN